MTISKHLFIYFEIYKLVLDNTWKELKQYTNVNLEEATYQNEFQYISPNCLLSNIYL